MILNGVVLAAILIVVLTKGRLSFKPTDQLPNEARVDVAANYSRMAIDRR